MFKRVIWFGSGFASGAASSWYVKRKVKAKVERFTPAGIRNQAGEQARRLQGEAKRAVNDGVGVAKRVSGNARTELEALRGRNGLRAVPD